MYLHIQVPRRAVHYCLSVSGESYHLTIAYATGNSNHNFFIRTNDATRFTVDTIGNVGIGVAAPEYKLDVDGNIQMPIDGIIGTRLASTGSNGYIIPYATGGNTVIWNTFGSSAGILFGTNDINSGFATVSNLNFTRLGNSTANAKNTIQIEYTVTKRRSDCIKDITFFFKVNQK